MNEQQILDALRENDIKTIRALREKDDALLLERELEAVRLRTLLEEVRNAAPN